MGFSDAVGPDPLGTELTLKTVVDSSGPHILTQGDYFPAWLRNFVTAVFTPVPDPSRWNLANAPIEHVEFPNGMRSSLCQHAEFKLGLPSTELVNFANKGPAPESATG